MIKSRLNPLFPKDFLWGAATSAYQIEGSPLADGAGASIWHRFAHEPDHILQNSNGDYACSHYKLYQTDVAWMESLGFNAYRFSIAWGRILPAGRGKLNFKGLDFYQRLISELLRRGIQPMITLYHWDLPLALEEQGGWLHPDSPAWFAEYAAQVIHALDDRVKLWVTLNEPWVIAVGGYLHGTLAPGQRKLARAIQVAHHLLQAHHAAVAVYRALGRGKIGIAVNLEPQYPMIPSIQDQKAAQQRAIFINHWFLDPIFFGRYPAEMPELFGETWSDCAINDCTRLQARPDFLGVNYYSRGLVRAMQTDLPFAATRVIPRHAPLTAMDWEVYPFGLLEILLWIKNRFGNPPVYITENGAAFDDPIPKDNQVHDPKRIEYLREHLNYAAQALQEGCDLRGYFVWSLLDNFEWSYGYSKRFGIIHVNFDTQLRVAKDSARFYAEVIRMRGINLIK